MRCMLIGAMALFACEGEPDPEAVQEAQNACIRECRARVAKNEDLSAGPCLSDALPGGLIAPDFVCDVAHDPRQDVDDEDENQCQAYKDDRADYFVEVDPSCSFIRAE